MAPLSSAMDELMIGVVMMDDEFDWAEDLDAGRYNVFVAYCSDLPQTNEWREANRKAVVREIYCGQVARPYFSVLREHLQRAKAGAQAVGCSGMVDYISWFEEEAMACGTWLVEESRSRLRAAARQRGNLKE